MSKLTTATATSAIPTLTATERDGIIMELHGMGYSLNMATNGYSAYAKANGLTATIVSHKDEVLEGLSAEYDEDSWTVTAVRNEVISIVAGYDVAESTARDYCKAFSELLGVDHPVSDPRALIFAWFKHHEADASKEDFIQYATHELGRSKSNANEYWKGYELHLFLVA